MPNDTPNTPVSSRVQELGALFAAPLVSVIEADVLAAKEFTRFITEYGFESTGTAADGSPDASHLGALRSVTFSYQRPGANGTLEDAVVQIPLLSLVPLPLLQVTDAEFSFNVRVLEADSSGLGAPPPLLDRPGESGDAPKSPPRVRAMLAQAPSRQSEGSSSRSELDANMEVKLAMKQADIPAGISALLNLMGQSIHSRSQA